MIFRKSTSSLSEATWRRLGDHLGRLGEPVGPLGRPSWFSPAPLGLNLEPLGRLLGPTWAQLGASWAPLGCILGLTLASETQFWLSWVSPVHSKACQERSRATKNGILPEILGNFILTNAALSCKVLWPAGAIKTSGTSAMPSKRDGHQNDHRRWISTGAL